MSLFRQTQLMHPADANLIKLHEIEEGLLEQHFLLANGKYFGMRLLRYADVPYVHQAIQSSIDHLANWLLFGDTYYSMQSAKAWVEGSIDWAHKGLGFEFILHHFDINQPDIKHPNNKHIFGGVCINPIDPGSRSANLGYWLTEKAQGQGMMSIAAMFAIHIAFSQLKLQRLELIIDIKNKASIALAHRLGGILEGRARNRLRINNDYHDAYIYSILAGDLGYA
jgi:ribosomal-protein-serine acetyltransferase